MLTLRLSRAVSTWVAWTVEYRSELVAEQHQHSLAAAQAELDTHKSAVVGRIVARLRLRDVAKCYDAWCDTVRQKQVLSNAVRRLSNLGAFSALRGWRHSTSESQRLRKVAGRLVAQLRHREATAAFRRWVKQTAWQIRARALLGLSLIHI